MPTIKITIEEEKKRRLKRSKSVSRSSCKDNHELSKINENQKGEAMEKSSSNKRLVRSESLSSLSVNNFEMKEIIKDLKKENEQDEMKKKISSAKERMKPSKSSSKLPSKNENAVSVPSIILHDPQDYRQIIKEIKKYVKHEFFTNLSKTGIKILFTNQNDFNKMKNFYENNDYVFHVCLCKNDKKLTVAIKGIPSALGTDEISKYLKQKFPIITIHRILNKFKQPSAMCCVEVVNNHVGREIFKLEYLLHSKVIVEKWRSERKELCSNCQKFKIKKIPVQNKTKCTKCSGNHNYTECTMLKINKAIKPVCRFCESYHDNYQQCPYYEKVIQDLKNVKKTINFHSNKNTTATLNTDSELFERNEKTYEEKTLNISEKYGETDGSTESRDTSHGLQYNSTMAVILLIFSIYYCYNYAF